MAHVLLSNLLKAVVPQQEAVPATEIGGLCLEGSRVQAGDLFVACVGDAHGRQARIDAAITQGAVAVLIAAETPEVFIGYRKLPHYKAVPVCSIPRLPEQFGAVAAAFYGHPSRSMQMIGCTGTNGKTSSTHFLAQALTLLDQPCGLIGGLGYGAVGHLEDRGLTTPDPLTLQQQLCILKQRGMDAVALEVSSHALAQGRLAGITFDISMMTNVTQDHLDYHGSMAEYSQAKQLLFDRYGAKQAVLNLNDPFGAQLAQSLFPKTPVYGYGLYESATPAPLPLSGWVCGYDLQCTVQGFSLQVETPWGAGTLEAPLLGRFNALNVLGVLTTLCVMGVDFQQALACFPQLRTVPGRMQTFGGGQYQPLVVVDYAHTPDALEQALSALRAYSPRRLFCVFGCGGARDQGKRRLMGEIAERYSDVIIVTSDNPRSEDAKKIAEAITSGLLCPWAVEVELDRKAAIAHALQQAQPGDIVLIAGKGDESYQQVGEERVHFSDSEQVQVLLSL